MFSGIVTAQGEVTAIDEGRITVCSDVVACNAKTGDSVAVNGVCLTVSALSDDRFTADVTPETMRRTALGDLRAGDLVNLEPSLRLGDAVGGHLVSGHIDGVGTIRAQRDEDNARWVHVDVPARLLPFIAEKGSIAIDGISLSVVDVEPSGFTVSLVPHTLRVTAAGAWRPGSRVNIEADLIARYVVRALDASRKAAPASSRQMLSQGAPSRPVEV
jgi:riboflavin synthase